MRTRWTLWDARQSALAAAVAAGALLVACLVTAASDEGGVAWAARAGRTLPVMPLCSAVGAWVALAPVRSRGEAVALAALGRSPLQIAAAAVAGAALVAVVAAAAVGVARWADVSGFFPTATRASAWAWTGHEFVDRARGIAIGADGAPARTAADLSAGVAQLPVFGRASAAASMALAGAALPLLVARALLMRARVLLLVTAAAGAMAASVLLFQAAAARLVPASLAPLPALALLVLAARQRFGATGSGP